MQRAPWSPRPGWVDVRTWDWWCWAAPVERLTHWLQVAAPVEGFVGFAIGRSIWEDALAAHTDEEETVEAISREYLRYARTYLDARA